MYQVAAVTYFAFSLHLSLILMHSYFILLCFIVFLRHALTRKFIRVSVCPLVFLANAEGSQLFYALYVVHIAPNPFIPCTYLHIASWSPMATCSWEIKRSEPSTLLGKVTYRPITLIASACSREQNELLHEPHTSSPARRTATITYDLLYDTNVPSHIESLPYKSCFARHFDTC